MSKAASYLLSLCAAAFLLLGVKTLASADVFADYENPTVAPRSAYHTDPSVNSRRTDHFLIRFGPSSRQGFMAENMFQGHLQFMEHVYDTWQYLGLRPLGGNDPNTKYKGIIQPKQTWDGDGGGGAVSFVEGPNVAGVHVPCNSLGYKWPNGCTPHEFGHGWQNTSGGIPLMQAQGFTEALANWCMSLQLASYPNLWPAPGVTGAHATNYYNTYGIFSYFMEAPGYGADFINKLCRDPNVSGESIIDKAIRLDTSGAIDKAGAIHDGLGMMNAKLLDNDFWNHRVDHFYPYDKDNQWNVFQPARVTLVRQPAVDGVWYRPEWLFTPQALGNSYIPLAIDPPGTARTVTCDFRPVADAVTGASYRACFVAFNKNKECRYSRQWNAGVNSFTLAEDENTLYLAVIAIPKVLANNLSHNYYASDYPAMYPYRVSFTGATPKAFDWALPSGYHNHTNGGGVVASTATVESTAYVGPNAMVLGTAKVLGSARIEDDAVIDGSAVIGKSASTADDPVVSGHAYVAGTAQVYGHAKVRDYAWIWSDAKVYDNAVVMAHSMLGSKDISGVHYAAQVHGNAVINQCPLREQGCCFINDVSGCAILGGDSTSYTAGVLTTPYTKGVWCEASAISVADNAYQYLGYNFEKKSGIFAVDQYGLNHSFLMGEPLVKYDSVNGTATNVLELNGTNQYVELRPDAVDFDDATVSMWVKWTGSGNADQRIFSVGDGAGKYMYLTPKDTSTGKLRFVISNGNTTQYLDGTAALPTNTWTHVAVTFSGDIGALYVNGTAVDTDATITTNPDQLNAALMANWNFIGRGNSGSYFQGRIDEFKVYNRAFAASEIASTMTVTAGAAAAVDTTAPTPNAAAWLVPPTAAGDNAITMSASEGTDAGGNGVLYYFRCIEDATHDSGWISESKYTDCKCAVGSTYTYAVRMKDKLGNTGTESAALSATTLAMDVTAPTPNPPTFAYGPKGDSISSITMTATKGVDTDDTVLYKFSRVGSTVTSGWGSSRTWTDTGLSSTGSYSYTLQMKDSHGNVTAITTSAAVTPKDVTPPALDADYRLQWEIFPYTQIDKTVRLAARQQAETTGVQYWYEIVGTATNSGWLTDRMWVTGPLADGTYSFRYKLKDAAGNESAWSTAQTAKVLPTNCYHDYALSQLAGLPDDTLVRFSGMVTQVNDDHYIISTPDNSTSIRVVPRAFGYKTDAAMLNQTVSVKGHLWTYTGTPKRVTSAIVSGSPQKGRIEFENCDYDDDLARIQYNAIASGCEYLGWFQTGWSIAVANVAATPEMSIAYSGGAGKLSMYLNGTHYKDVTFPGTTTGVWDTVTLTGLSIPQGATLRFQQDSGDTAPNLDYLVIGSTYTVSGKVTNSSGVGIAGANVYFANEADARVNQVFTVATDASGNYSKAVPAGTWYVAASADAQAYYTSPDQKVIVSNANVPNTNFTLQAVTRNLPRTADLLFSCLTDMLPPEGSLISSWPSYQPSGMSFNSKGGTPDVQLINGRKWVNNVYGFATPDYISPIPVNGVTIVAAVMPVRRLNDGQSWPATVDLFFDRVNLGIWNATGKVYVRRNGVIERADDVVVPENAMSVVSLVVQPTGEYKIYLNGTLAHSVTTQSDMTSLVPGVLGVYAKALSIGSNGPDTWSSFSGYIGDVAVYKVALTDAERVQAERDFSSRFGGQSHTISAHAGTGGTISPNGASVDLGQSQTFTITPDDGYEIGDVLVDGQSQGPIDSYTFSDVISDHDISATFVRMPDSVITVSSGAHGKISPAGTVVTLRYHANQTFTITPDPGYTVQRLTVDGQDVADANAYTFSSVTQNHSISVTFGPCSLPSPVAFYQFESNCNDSSPNNYNGTAYGTQKYYTGKVGKGFQFNGSTYVVIPKPISTDFTIAFWMKSTANSLTGTQWYNGNGIVDGEVNGTCDDFGVSYLNNKIAFGVGNPDTTIQSQTSVYGGTYYHVACTRDSDTGQMKIYINGALEATGTGPTGPKTSATGLNISRLLNQTNYLNGSLDQVRLYDKVLNADQVSALVAETTPTWTINALCGPNGSITPSGAVSVAWGVDKTFTITPAAGYGVAGLTVDQVPVAPVTIYTFGGVSANHTIYASFDKVYGVNNRTLLTDGKVVGKVVKAWGKVGGYASGGVGFTISDGYAIPVTVKVNASALPSGFANGKTAVVMGLWTNDGAIQAQDIHVY